MRNTVDHSVAWAVMQKSGRVIFETATHTSPLTAFLLWIKWYKCVQPPESSLEFFDKIDKQTTPKLLAYMKEKGYMLIKFDIENRKYVGFSLDLP